MPAARQRSRSRAMTLAVSAMIVVGGRPRSLLVGADGLGGGVTVHAGHLAVHQDRIEALAARVGHGDATVLRDHDLAVEFLEHRDGHLAVDGVVVRHQHVEPSAGWSPRSVVDTRSTGADSGRNGLRGWRDGLQGAAQELLANRLGDADVGCNRLRALVRRIEVERAQQHDVGARDGRVEPDRAQQLLGRRVGQAVIEQHDVERPAARGDIVHPVADELRAVEHR